MKKMMSFFRPAFSISFATLFAIVGCSSFTKHSSWGADTPFYAHGNADVDGAVATPFSAYPKSKPAEKNKRKPASSVGPLSKFEKKRNAYVESERAVRAKHATQAKAGKNYSSEKSNAPVVEYVDFLADAKKVNATMGMNRKLLAYTDQPHKRMTQAQKMMPKPYEKTGNFFDQPGKTAQKSTMRADATRPLTTPVSLFEPVNPHKRTGRTGFNEKYTPAVMTEAEAKTKMLTQPKWGSNNKSGAKAQYKAAMAAYKDGVSAALDSENTAKIAAAIKAVPKSISYSDDYYEPNDYQSSAYSITNRNGYWLPSSYGYQCDDDWFKIYVSPSYKQLTLDLRFTHSEGDIDMKLYNESGSNIASSTSSSSDEFINIRVDSSGYYYVKVYYDDNCNNYDLKWSTAYTGVTDDYYEQNDSQSSAYNLNSYENTWLESVHGFGVAYDDDYYGVYVENGYNRLVVDTRFYHSYGDIDMKVYGPCTSSSMSSCYSSYSEVASSTSSSDDEYIDRDNLAQGWYFIKIYPFSSVSSGSEPNVYNMKWYLVQTRPAYTEDNKEPNDFRSTSNPEIRHGDNFTLNQFDEDWFKFTVAGNGTRKVRFDLRYVDSASYGDIDMRIIDQDGYLIAASETSSSTGEYIETIIPDATETYYVQVFGDNTGNKYTLSYQNLTSAPAEDNYEQNDSQTSISAAANLSDKQNRFLSNISGTGTLKDDDWYKIHVVGGYRHVVVDLRYAYRNEGGGIQDMDLELRDSNGGLVMASRTLDNDEYIDTVVPDTGDYFIKVTRAGGAPYPDSTYDLKWYSAADDSNLNDSFTRGWYNPATNYQGWFFEFVKRTDQEFSSGLNQFIAAFFTYDPADSSPNQHPHWLYAQGFTTGNKANMDIYLTSGGVFGQPPKPSAVKVGTATFTATDCMHGKMALHITNHPGMAAYDAVIDLEGLSGPTTVNGRETCGGATRVATPTVSPKGIQKGHIGQWFHRPHDGQGFFFNYVNQGATERMVGAYYTYSPFERTGYGQYLPTDRKMWWYLDGDINNASAVGKGTMFLSILTPTRNTGGGRFNQGTPVPTFVTIGTAALSFNSCTGGHFKVISVNPGFEEYVPVRLDVPLEKIGPVPTYNGQPLCTWP